MIANYHTHTFRCSHADGTDEEYILKAIEGGIKIMGFSDHAPAILYDGYRLSWRVQPEAAPEYFDTLKALREKYKDKIEIHIGFEMEYYPDLFDKMYSYVKELGAEYLILGQHYYDELGGVPHSIVPCDSADSLIAYTDSIIKGMKTGKFIYIAHPDMFNFTGDDELYEAQARRICQASKDYDIPLELNLLGIHDKRNYPNRAFLKVAGEVGCKMIFGFDAHSPWRAYDAASIEKAEDLVKKYNLNLIDTVEIKI